MDRFFDGAFLTFGLEVIAFAEQDQEDRIDPMVYIFPRMTKCTFHKFGSSGEIEKHDAMCILPLNIVNEKIYIFLWFWMIILMLLTLLVPVYRFLIVFSPRMRAYLMYLRFRVLKREVINVIIKKSLFGDWMLIYLLGQNIDSLIFKDVMQELARKLGYHNKDIFWTNCKKTANKTLRHANLKQNFFPSFRIWQKTLIKGLQLHYMYKQYLQTKVLLGIFTLHYAEKVL